jgi:hypothetical protein
MDEEPGRSISCAADDEGGPAMKNAMTGVTVSAARHAMARSCRHTILLCQINSVYQNGHVSGSVEPLSQGQRGICGDRGVRRRTGKA